MAIKKSIVAKYLARLRDVHLSLDTFLFTIVMISPGSFVSIPDNLTLVRVHDTGETQYLSDNVDLRRKSDNIRKLIQDYELFSEIASESHNTELFGLMQNFLYTSKYLLFFIDPNSLNISLFMLTIKRVVVQFRNIRTIGWGKSLKHSIGFVILLLIYFFSKERAFCLYMKRNGLSVSDCKVAFRQINGYV